MLSPKSRSLFYISQIRSISLNRFISILFIVPLLLSPALVNSANGDELIVPEWVKSTVKLWSDDKISHKELVNAIEYLVDHDIIKLSTQTNEEILREVEYLKAKNEVVRDEVQDLRKDNEEYRILLKSQELTEDQLPTSISNLFTEHQKLQSEVKILREINKQFSQQVDSWITSNTIPDFNIALKSDGQNNLVQIEAEYQTKINSLQQQNINYQNQIDVLVLKAGAFEKKVELLSTNNEGHIDLIEALRDRNQENRGEVNELLQERSNYLSQISQLESETSGQKKILSSYQDDLGNFEGAIQSYIDENQEYQGVINQLQEENTQYQTSIEQLESVNKEQLNVLVSFKGDLDGTSLLVNSLNSKILEYETTISSLENQNSQFQNLVTQLENENFSYENVLSQLEYENEEHLNSLLSILSEAEDLGFSRQEHWSGLPFPSPMHESEK